MAKPNDKTVEIRTNGVVQKQNLQEETKVIKQIEKHKEEQKSGDHPRMQELREKVMKYIEENENVFHPDDVKLLRTNNLWINRFLHFLDQPFEKAFNHLVETFKFRKEKGIHTIDKKQFSIECWLSSTAFIYLPDREGLPILYVRVKNHLKGEPQLNEFFRMFLMVLIDQIDKLGGKEGGFDVFLDLYGMGLKNLDLEMLSFLVELARYKYPNGMKYCFVHGLPWYLNIIIKNIVAALPSDTSKKMKFISGTHYKELGRDQVTSNFSKSPSDLNNNQTKSEEVTNKNRTKLEIEEFIDLDNLPSFLGGRATLNERIMPRNTSMNLFKVGTTLFQLSESETERMCKPFQNVINDSQNAYKAFKEQNLEFEFDLEDISTAYINYLGL